MFESIVGLERVFWLIAVPATVVFAIQSFLMLIGVTIDHTELPFFHHDATAHGYSPIFTVRNAVVFFMMFGWTGIALIREYQAGPLVTIGVSTLVGIGMMFVVMLMFYGISRMASSGNFQPDDSLVGLEASVYLKIFVWRSGSGKILVMAGGRKREFSAQTHGDELPTHAMVKILEVHPDVLIVGSRDGAGRKSA